MNRSFLGLVMIVATMGTTAQEPGAGKPAAAQPGNVPSPPPAEIKMDATTIILTPRTYAVRELVDAAAKFLDRNILLDDRELQTAGDSRLTLQTTMRLDRPGFEEVFCDLLDAGQLLLLTRDEAKGLYEVVAGRGQRAAEAYRTPPTRSVEEILRRPSLKQPVSTFVPLRQTSGSVVANYLRPAFVGGPGRGWFTISTGPNNGSVVLAGMQADVARAIEIIQQADVKPDVVAQGGPKEDRLAKLEQQIAALQRELAELKQRLPAKVDEKR